MIDADAMREEWLENGENEYVYDTNAFLASIDEQPTIKAVPVVHGEWKIVTPENLDSICIYEKCSCCGWREPMVRNLNFCPNCGADMRKKV